DGIGGLNPVDDAAEIDVDDPVPRLDGVIANLATCGDPRIIEEVVESPVLFRDALDESPDALEVADIDGNSAGGRPRRTRDAGRPVDHLRLQVSESHGGPSARQLL